MAINILQELNLGAAKASFSRDEVETLADIKKLDVAQKYPNNYDIFCKEDGCKYRLNKTSHSTMQDNLPHPTGKWRRVDSVISSNMPAPITVGDVVLYLGPTVMDQVDHSKVKFQTGKYYRTEYTKVNKQMYAFVQNTAPDVPDTSPNPAVIWFSETSTLSEGSVLFTPVNGSIFDNKEHGIIMTSDWDGQSAISGSSYEYLDNSNNAKLGMVRNSNFDITFDSFPELTWNMFDTEAELENIKQNVIPEAISSATEEIKTEVKEEVKEDVDANLGQAKKLNDILTDGDIKLLKQGGIEKLVSSKPDATVSDSTIGFVQCDCNRNEETGEVTLNITDVKYGPFTQEEIAENVFVDEDGIIVPSSITGLPIYAITCSVTNKAKDAILCGLKDSNLYKGTLSFDAMSFLPKMEEEGLPIVIGFAAAAPYKDEEHSGSVDSNTYVSLYNLLEIIAYGGNPAFTPVPVSEIPDIKNRAVELLEKETVLDLILFVACYEELESQLASSNILDTFNEQFVIGTEASGILNEFPTMRKEIEDSITEEFSTVKKLNDSLNEEDVETIVSRPRESLFDAKSPYIPYGNKLLTECTFVKLEFDDNGVATITDSATVSDALSLPNPMEWLHDGQFAVLFGIMQSDSYVGYQRTTADIYNCSFKVDYESPDIDISRKPENMFGIDSVYFAVGNNGDGWGEIEADFTACKFTDIDTYAPGTEDVDGRHLFGDLIGDYEENGTPITLRNYSKSNYTVLYGIALFDASGNVISESDYTSKNITASINKRVVPAYQESGLLVDFPKIKEQIASVKTMADEFGTVKQNANKASKLADRFTDAEMDKLFKKITEKIISSVNGVNDVDFRICACTSSDNWETATITKYMEAPLSGDLTDYHISLPGAYGNTFDTIAVSCGISFTNGNSATGLPYYEVINNKAINTWLNAYLLDPVAIYTAQTSSSSSFDKSTYYKTRVKDGGPSDSTIKYSDMEPLKSNAYEWSSRIHFLVFIQVNNNTTAEDLNAADLFELAKKAIVPVGTTSGIVSEFDTVKQNANSAKAMADEFDTVKQNANNAIEYANNAIELALPEKTKDYIKNKLYDIKTVELRRASESESQGIAYDNTNCNGLISIGSSYDHQDESRSISVTFKNYFDSSKSDYVSASEVIAIKDAAEWYQRTNYIAIPVIIKGYGGRTKESILESLKGVIASKSSSAYMIKKKTSYGASPYGKLVDVYGGLTSDSFGNAHLNLLSFSSLSRANESTFSIAELLSDAVVGASYYQTPCLILVYDVYYVDSPEISPDIITELDTEDLVKNTFNIYSIPIENRIDQLEQNFDGIETAVSSVSDTATAASAKANSLETATKSIIQKYPIKIATSSDSGFNGALKINADTYDPETTTSVSLSFYNYYDSSKSNYRNPANPATPMLVEDKFVAVPAFIDIAEVLGVPSFTSASQLKEYCKNISVRFDRNQSIKVDLQNNNNTSIYSGANVFIRDIYFRTYSTAQAPAQAATYSTKITNSNPIAELVDASYSPGFIPIFIFILEVIPDVNYSVPLKNYLAQQNFAKFINSLCEISFNKVRDAEDKAQEAVENISSVADSIDNISDSMSDYMSAKWLPTPIAFPDEALENEQEPSGNSKNYDFLLYPTFVDAPHSTGSSVEGKKSRYSVKPIPESGENTTVKALYESEDSMYLLFGFFGEKLLPESLGGDYTIPETYNENTIESFNRTSKTLWYSDIYLNMQNTFSYSMIKGIRDSLLEIDVSNIFLNFNPRVIKSLYAKVTADPGNELTYSTYTNRGLNNMEDFVKIPYANIQDINTISMEDIVNMCGRPDKTKSSGSSKAVILFIAEIDKSSFPGLASLTTPAYGVSNTTSDILAIYQAMFANNSESSPIYMARSIDDSLKKTKEVAVEAARYAAATLTAAKHYDTLSDLKRLISEGESGYIVRNGETEGTSVADVYIKTTEGALIKIASGVEYEAPIS